jgi:hypothetical protein
MEEARLHELVAAFQAGLTDRDAVFERIARELYANPLRFGFDSDDDASEALCRYRERIKSLAARYVDKGVPFDAYLSTSLRFIARTLRRERKRRREREQVCEVSESWKAEGILEEGLSSCEEVTGLGSPGLAPMPRPGQGRRRSGPEVAAFRSRLVFLYLKCAWDADDEKTRRVARAAAVPEDWLAAATAQSLRALEPERGRFERLSGRRDKYWGRLRLLEARLAAETDVAERQRLAEALKREKTRFENACTRLKSFKPTVPNSIVARILGVPKGTVDSGLYYLKRHASRT